MSIIINNRVHFSHIPRCGGKFVEKLLVENGQEVFSNYLSVRVSPNLSTNTSSDEDRYVELSHLHYPWYNEYLPVENMPHIAVVRNPIDRFHSTLKGCTATFLKGRLSKAMIERWTTDEEYFFNWIDKAIESNESNYFLPQYRFVTDKTYIWKLEDGLGNGDKENGEGFFYWLSRFGINITNKNISKHHVLLSPQDKASKLDYPEEWGDLPFRCNEYIKKYYKKDFERFKY